MEIQVKRKVAVNKWIINARWFYMLGIFFIGFLTKRGGHTNVSFEYSIMIGILVSALGANILLYFMWCAGRKRNSEKILDVLGCLQIIIELVIIVFTMHMAGGIESISLVFFFLPIVSSSLLFGIGGSTATAVISGVLVNALVFAEYYGLVPHINRYGVETLEYRYISISIIKTLNISVFYIIIGLFSGYGSSMLFSRERAIAHKTRELEGEKNKVSAILENFKDPIIFLDNSNCINFFNDAAREILGLSQKNVGQKVGSKNKVGLDNFSNIIKTEYKSWVPKNNFYGRSIEEVSLKYRDESRNYKVITAFVYNNNKTRYGVMKMFYDVTREKMMDKMKSEFISVAAHQLRTPLSALKWIIKMLLDEDLGSLNQEQKRLLGRGYDSNEWMISLINDMLNVSHIEEGRFSFDFTISRFSDVIDKVIQATEKLAANKKIEITVNQDQENIEVYIDREKMFLALQNLVDNAIKYTPKRGHIIIKTEILDDFLKVSVEDDGIGISKKGQSRIFSKFYRAENAKRVETDGNGLGLYIAKNIINQHDGDIYVKSKEGKGSTFVFSIPLKH